jgi:transcriptional regulator with XRE-family HTH domain
MFDMKEIGKRISTLRKKKGLTQMELANKFGISFQAVSNWERGAAMPDISNLTDLANALDSTVDYILGDEKTTRVLADLESGNVPDKSITPEEFNSIAPLLPPEKNDLLINSVNNQFNDEEAEKARPNLGFGGEYDDSDDNLARKAFEKNQVAMFSILLSGISEKCASELFAKAQERNSLPFIALLMRRVTREDKRTLARKAFEDNNIAIFSMTKQYMTAEEISFFRQKAF